jgi:hypothetical protein
VTISYVANSTMPTGTGTGTGTSSLSLGVPAGERLGDLHVAFVHCRPESAAIPTPDGWTAVSNGEVTGGFGSQANDTGLQRLKAFYRMGGLIAAKTVTLTSSPTACQGIVCCVRSTIPGCVWDVAGANGSKNTGGTPYSCTFNVNPGITSGDMVLVFGGIASDVTTPAEFSAETLTATGLTSGSVTEIGEPETTQGFDLGGVLCRWSPSAGPSSTAPAFSATAATTNTNSAGPLVLVRVREVAAVWPVSGAVPPSPLVQVRRAA